MARLAGRDVRSADAAPRSPGWRRATSASCAARGALGEIAGSSRRPTPTSSPRPLATRLRSGEARRRAEAELAEAASLGVRDRGPGRAGLSRAPAPGSTIRRPCSTSGATLGAGEGRSSRRDRGIARRFAAGQRPGPRPGAATWPRAGAHGRLGPRPRHRHRRPPRRPRGRGPHGGRPGLRPRPPLPARRTPGSAARDRASGARRLASSRSATEPCPGHFPRRNRIIAGWGRGRRGRGSGRAERRPRHGARCALDEGREVMAVPGHPAAARLAAGTNELIRDGAVLVRDAADVAAELGRLGAASARSSASRRRRARRPCSATRPRAWRSSRPAAAARCSELLAAPHRRWRWATRSGACPGPSSSRN